MDSYEDTYTISMELSHDIVSYCYDKIMSCNSLKFEDRVYQIWKSLEGKK